MKSAAAMQAFNHMADQLQQARERLIQVTRVASWQALARKMAHEVKNSLTPIRLTMEEIIASRHRAQADGAFLEQAAQIVADEVQTLEKRVKAFSEFAVGAAGDAGRDRLQRAGGGADRVSEIRASGSDYKCDWRRSGRQRSPIRI